MRLDGSYFFNTGSLSHELKFGAGYRTVDLDSLTIWPGNGYNGDPAAAVRRLPDYYFVRRGARVSSSDDRIHQPVPVRTR
jgi:hypothetical protein